MSTGISEAAKPSRSTYLATEPHTMVPMVANHRGTCMPPIAEVEKRHQDLDVLTPNGPVPIKDIERGDTVYSYNSDGTVSPVEVLEYSDLGVEEVVEITYRGRVIAIVPLGQGWLMTRKAQRNGKQISKSFTGETQMLSEGKGCRVARCFPDIPCGDVHEPHAYAIGAMLGDGCCNQWTSSSLYISSPDESVPRKVADILGAPYYKQHKATYTYRISHVPSGSRSVYKPRDYGNVVLNHSEYLIGKRAHEKSFPWEIVDTWDRESLLAFLAGLIDTDGSVFRPTKAPNSLNISFSSVSKELIDLFCQAVYKQFQIRPNVTSQRRNRTYANGNPYRPEHGASILSTMHARRILRELNPHLVSPSRKWKSEYENLVSREKDDRIGVKLGDIYFAQTYALVVDSDTHLYVLANHGLIAQDLSGTVLDAVTGQGAK